MNKLLYLEISRGIAALLVVFHHASLGSVHFLDNKIFSSFFGFGHHGVDFFFVLSGFIIYYIHSKDSNDIDSIKKYFIKRVIRIYPMFLLISTVLLGAYLLFPSMSAGERENALTFSRVVYSFLLLPSEAKPILSVSWTLIHEMFFYIVFIILIINKKFALYLFSVWAILIVFYNLFFEGTFPFSFYLSSHNIEFLLGIIVAYVYLNYSNRMDMYCKYFLLIGFVGFFLNGMNTNYGYIDMGSFSSIFVYGISSSLIIYGLVSLKNPIKRSYLFRTFLLIGSASYVIYIVHNPLLSLLFRLVKKIQLELYLNDLSIFLLLCLVSVGVGIIMHLTIEKPTIKYLRKKFIRT